jgi:hypothetical protein
MRVVCGGAEGRQIGQDLANARAELVAVPGEAGCDNDVALFGQHVDDEVFVRRVHEHAGLLGDRRPERRRQIAFDAEQRPRVCGNDAPVDCVGIDALAAMMELADFEAFTG